MSRRRDMENWYRDYYGGYDDGYDYWDEYDRLHNKKDTDKEDLTEKTIIEPYTASTGSPVDDKYNSIIYDEENKIEGERQQGVNLPAVING